MKTITTFEPGDRVVNIDDSSPVESQPYGVVRQVALTWVGTRRGDALVTLEGAKYNWISVAELKTYEEPHPLVGRRARHKQPCRIRSADCEWSRFERIVRVKDECVVSENGKREYLNELEIEENECRHEKTQSGVTPVQVYKTGSTFSDKVVVQASVLVCANPACAKLLLA